jgi:hypothetical protein
MAKQKNVFDAAVEHQGRTTSKGIKVPCDFAEGIVAKFNEIGTFKLSVTSVNELLGLTHANHRAGAIRKQLNKVHKDLVPEGQEWYVGTTSKDSEYVFGLREKKEE